MALAKPLSWWPGYTHRHGLVALFPCWEGSGAGINEIVAGRNGTFNASGIAWTFSEYGSSVNLDAVNTDDITHANILELGTDYTIVAFVRAKSTTGNHSIASDESGTPIRYRIDQNNGDLRMLVRDDANTLAIATHSSVITAGEWFVAAGRRNGGLVDIFHDGISTTQASESLGAIAPGSAAIGNTVGDNISWDGDISVVAIFNYAIPDDLIPSRPEAVFSLLREPDPIAILSAGVAAAGNAMPMAMDHYRRMRVA